MTRIRDGYVDRIRVEEYGADERNVIANTLHMSDDGWIKILGANVGGKENSVSLVFSVYNNADHNEKLWESSGEVVGVGAQDHTVTIPDGKAIRKGGKSTVYVAVTTDPSRGKAYGIATDSGKYFTKRTEVSGSPNTFEDYQERDGQPTIWMWWIKNHKPPQGNWRDSTPQGYTAVTTPEFSGTLPQHPDEEGLDFSERVQIQVWRNDRGPEDRMLLNTAFSPTDEENAQGYFVRTFDELTVPLGVECTVRYRHRDSWGEWSDQWSVGRTFTMQNGPLNPTGLTPNGKVNSPSPVTFGFNYMHTQGLPGKAFRIQVYNAHKTIIVWDSGWVSQAIAGGTELDPTVVSWTAPSTGAGKLVLEDGRQYYYQVRARARNAGNTQDIDSDWSGYQDLRLNAAPRKPSGLTPNNGLKTTDAILRATLKDPDPEDRVTQVQIMLYDITAGNYVAGYTSPGKTVNIASGTKLAHPASGMVLNHRYRWRVRASDGVAYGSYSDWAEFTYIVAPIVAIMAPDVSLVRNEVYDPSAEYATSTFWTITGTSGTRFIERVADGNAAYGDVAWLAHGDSGTGLTMTSDYIIVDPTRPLVCYVEAKKNDGNDPATNVTLRLACYDSSNALISRVVPGTVAPLNAANIPDHWTRYGGLVWPSGSSSSPHLPSGTAKVKIEFLPTEGSAAAVRFDAFMFYSLPYVPAQAEWDVTKFWYGYIDGDQQSVSTTVESYRWEGVPGAAPSTGPNVLNAASGVSILITYTSPQGRAKTGDRLIIQRWNGERWVAHYDAGAWTGADRTLIPMPSGVIQNETRYRMQVSVLDTVNLEGVSPWSEFEVNYTGPPELNIIDVQPSEDTATITMTFQGSDLEAESFNRIEIGMDYPDGTVTVVDRIDNPGTVTWTWHAPESGKTQRFRVRQVENQGSEVVHGRWSAVDFFVDFWPFFFLKSVDDPEHKRIRFEAQRSSPPERTGNQDMDSYVPWGSSKPVHIMGEADYETGTLQILFFDADNYIPEPAADRLALLRQMRTEETLILLMQLPGERRFVTITEISYGITDTLLQSVSLTWEESDYTIDYYERTGDSQA